MIEIHKQKFANQKPPYWYFLKTRVVVVDPRGHHIGLDEDTHHVYGLRKVKISIQCAEPMCRYHALIRLLNYEPIARPGN